MTYVALHEVIWCMVVRCTQNVPRRQQFHVAPAMSALLAHHFSGYSKTRFKKLIIDLESHAITVSLLEGGQYRYIKAINMNINLM